MRKNTFHYSSKYAFQIMYLYTKLQVWENKVLAIKNIGFLWEKVKLTCW